MHVLLHLTSTEWLRHPGEDETMESPSGERCGHVGEHVFALVDWLSHQEGDRTLGPGLNSGPPLDSVFFGTVDWN